MLGPNTSYRQRTYGISSTKREIEAKMGVEAENNGDLVRGQLLRLSFKTFGRITVSLPLGSLLFCFTTAMIFQFNEVNKTECNVKNLVPSISAITGVTPQRYVWRICIALHSTPRFAIGIMYYNYYISRLHYIVRSQRFWYAKLVSFNFWCYTIENSCLVGVTYIANVENYPIHEKLFVLFMATSIVYELMTLVLFRWAHPEMETSPRILKSYRMKKGFFITIVSFSCGLLYFFLRHRLYCEPNAFTKFACCEYAIVLLNISYHYSVIWDMHEKNQWLVGEVASSSRDRNANHKLD